MNPSVTAALIGLIGIVVGAILREALPGSRMVSFLTAKPIGHNLLGSWESTWGAPPDGPFDKKETVIVTRQRGQQISGYVTSADEPNRKWSIDGRYDGHFLQMHYYPSVDSKDADFLDYGCYFFTRQADGTFRGYSTGFGPADNAPGEGLTIQIHRMRRV